MNRHGLILLEGLPGAGKSTTAHLLSLHLNRQGIAASWRYEHETPHPVYEYPDIQAALDQGELRAGLFEEGLANWKRLTADGGVLILESSFWQTAIHPMLLLNWDRERIASFVHEVAASILNLKPALVYLRHEDVAAALRAVGTSRGEWFLEFIERRLTNSAYGRARNLHGFDGLVTYLEAYRSLVDELAEQLQFPVVRLAAGALPKEQFLPRICTELGLAPFEPFTTNIPNLECFTGNFRQTESEDVFPIITDGSHLYVDGSPPTRLIHRTGAIFELLGTCVTLEFQSDRDGVIHSIDCRGNLPNLAREWIRQ